jgi:polysaccharide pyruvyl transferase WcaK-like protein
MGNTFVDLGALHLLKSASPDFMWTCSSRFSRFYAQYRTSSAHRRLMSGWRAFDVAEHARVDIVAVAGNVLDDEFVRREGPVIRALVGRGARFIILGGGASRYSPAETRAVCAFMASVGVSAFISRDAASHEAFAACAGRAYAGIDCAFYVADAYRPAPLALGDYVVCCFNDQHMEDTLGLSGRQVVRTRHYHFYLGERFKRKRDDTLVSDCAEDYLTVYAHADAVYADRVHACVAALAYGRPARLYAQTPRAGLFEEVGAAGIVRNLTRVDPALLADRQREQVDWLAATLRELVPAGSAGPAAACRTA